MSIEQTKSIKLNNLLADLDNAGYASIIVQENHRDMGNTYHLSVSSKEKEQVGGRMLSRRLMEEDMEAIRRLAKKRKLLTFSDKGHSELSAYYRYTTEDPNEYGLVFLDQRIIHDTAKGVEAAIDTMLQSPQLLKGEESYEAALAIARDFQNRLADRQRRALFEADGSVNERSFSSLRVITKIFSNNLSDVAQNLKFFGTQDAGTSLLLEVGGKFCGMF